jgi:O-antigen/teichoic acid export membrane protein
LDAVALSLPLLFISSTYGVYATGNYAQIQRLIGGPLLLFSVVLGQIFFKYSGELHRAGKSSNQLFWQTIKLLMTVAFLLLLLLVFIGKPACKLLLGGGWRVDTLFLLLVTIPFVCRSVVSPISTVFLTHHRVNLAMRWQVGYFITTVTVLYCASKLLNFEQFLLIYGIHEIVMYGFYLAMANRVVAAYMK